MVIFYQWPKLNLGFDVEPEFWILKVIYWLLTFALGFPWHVTSSSQWSVSRIVHRKTPCARNWFVATTIAQCAVMMPLHIPIIAICKWLRVRLAYNWHILGNALKVWYSEKASKIWKILHIWAFHPILVTWFLVVFGDKVTKILHNSLFTFFTSQGKTGKTET